jgi:hypothetical protein
MAQELPRIVFLHLPKTAGQSIHSALVKAYGAEAVAPLRVNPDLDRYAEERLLQYRVFSGHLDWNRLQFVPNPVVMTMLRDPLERIASFCLFLRKQAEALPLEVLSRPDKRGMYLALHLPPDDYFCDPDLPERGFLDDRFDKRPPPSVKDHSTSSATSRRKWTCGAASVIPRSMPT